MKKVFCKNCKYSHYNGDGYCLSAKAHSMSIYTLGDKLSLFNKFVNDVDKETYNQDGECKYYKKSWYKFWVK